MRTRTILLVLFFSIASATAFSQNVVEELNRVRQAYLQSSEMSFDVEVLGYASKNDKKGFKIGKGNVVKSKDAYYSLYAKEEFLKTPKSVIIIDHETKEINVFENAVSNKKADQNNPVVIVDSIIKRADSVKYEGMLNNQKKLCIYDTKSVIVKTELFINSLTNYIEKVVYHYAASDMENDYSISKAVILYKNIKNTISSSNLLAESRILVRGKKSIGLTESYKGYKLSQNQNIDL